MKNSSHKLIKLKEAYFNYLDRKARHLAYTLKIKKHVTRLVLDYIKELYQSANLEKAYNKEGFESAYHNPVSSEMEFLISRMLYHYSRSKKLGWKIYLRRQVGKAAPDIRIEKNNKTLAIIEIKAKAGWIQCFLSKETFNKELNKYKNGIGKATDPRALNKRLKDQLRKYYDTFNITRNHVYVLLPTLKEVHRANSNQKINDYLSFFSKTSRLPRQNLILLSSNLSLNLSEESKRKDYKPTNLLEGFVKRVTELAK
jgi:hypothetical protein